MDIFETFDCVPHIDKPTHNSGHLLDSIITRKDSSGVSNFYLSDFICNHRALHVSLTCNRVNTECKQIDVRSLKRIQCDALEADLIGVYIDRECTDVNLVNMMRHFHDTYWINMHRQNVFMLLKDL